MVNRRSPTNQREVNSGSDGDQGGHGGKTRQIRMHGTRRALDRGAVAPAGLSHGLADGATPRWPANYQARGGASSGGTAPPRFARTTCPPVRRHDASFSRAARNAWSSACLPLMPRKRFGLRSATGDIDPPKVVLKRLRATGTLWPDVRDARRSSPIPAANPAPIRLPITTRRARNRAMTPRRPTESATTPPPPFGPLDVLVGTWIIAGDAQGEAVVSWMEEGCRSGSEARSCKVRRTSRPRDHRLESYSRDERRRRRELPPYSEAGDTLDYTYELEGAHSPAGVGQRAPGHYSSNPLHAGAERSPTAADRPVKVQWLPVADHPSWRQDAVPQAKSARR